MVDWVWFNRTIDTYRDLVDRWRMWSYRAKFDIARRRLEPSAPSLKEGHSSAAWSVYFISDLHFAHCASRHCRQSLSLYDLSLPRNSCLPVRFGNASLTSSSTTFRMRVQGNKKAIAVRGYNGDTFSVSFLQEGIAALFHLSNAA
jgi:hypothetical protein